MQSKEVDLRALMDGSSLRPVQITTFALCGLVALLDGVDSQSFIIAAPSIAASFGMKVAQFGPAFAAAHLGACVGALVCGPLSDVKGRKRVLIGATLTFAVFTVLTAFARSYDGLLAVRFCAGLGLGGAVPCFLALASEYAPTRHRGALASLLWAAYPLGGMVGGFTNAVIVADYGWPMMFYVGGGLPLLVALLLVAALPESPAYLSVRDSASPGLRRIAGRLGAPSSDAGTRYLISEQKVGRRPVLELFSDRRLAVTLSLWVAFFAAFGLLNVVVSWTPAVLLSAGIPASGAANVIGFFNLAAVIGMSVAGRLVDRFGAPVTLVPSLVVAAAATWMMSMVGTTVQASAALMLFGLSLGCAASGLIAIATTFYETRMRGTGIGWGMAIGRFGQVVAPLLTGMLMVGGMPAGRLMQTLAGVPFVVAAAVLLTHWFARRSALPAYAPASQPTG